MSMIIQELACLLMCLCNYQSYVRGVIPCYVFLCVAFYGLYFQCCGL